MEQILQGAPASPTERIEDKQPPFRYTPLGFCRELAQKLDLSHMTEEEQIQLAKTVIQEHENDANIYQDS